MLWPNAIPNGGAGRHYWTSHPHAKLPTADGRGHDRVMHTGDAGAESESVVNLDISMVMCLS